MKQYKNPNKKRDYIEKEERTDLQRYIRDSLKWQKWTFYIVLGIGMITLGVYARLIFW